MVAENSDAGRFAGKVSEGVIAEVWRALGRYRAELEASGLPLSARISRYQQARLFAQWMDGHYELG